MELVGDGTWPFLVAAIDGEDIVVRGAKGTRFGGTDDGQDNGEGASGFQTAQHPEYLGVSLPMAHSHIATMDGCPIPHLPWYTPVKVYSRKTFKVSYGHLIDIGPSKDTGHAIDMTNALVHSLGLSLDDGVYNVDYRIIGAAKYVKTAP